LSAPAEAFVCAGRLVKRPSGGFGPSSRPSAWSEKTAAPAAAVTTSTAFSAIVRRRGVHQPGFSTFRETGMLEVYAATATAVSAGLLWRHRPNPPPGRRDR